TRSTRCLAAMIPFGELGPGESCTVDVKFKPTSTGTKNANLAVASDAPTVNHGLTGEGTNTPAAISVTPATPDPTDFGSRQTGTTSDAVTYTITNTGGADLGLDSIELGGTNADQFD